MEVILFILFLIGKVFCFNFDVDFPIIFKEPVTGNSRSYFGYAIAMYPGKNLGTGRWIRIGAPRANDPWYPKVSEPGTVYDCQIMLDCKPMKIPRTPKVDGEIWNYGWIGGTMDVSYYNNTERLAVCGFRHYYEMGRDYRTMGTCFWSFLNSTLFETISPLLDFDKTVSYVKQQSVYLYGQGQAGFSAHFPSHENELVLGAPGIYNWAGSPFRVKDRITYIPEPSRRRRDLDPFKTVEIPDATKNEIFNLFGYSVSSGYFYGKDILYYVAGSPKAFTYKGKVVVFTFGSPGKAINEKEHKIGQEFGEYFGASLGSGNINGDNYDDLLVGAPYWGGKTYNEGRVFIFLGGKESMQLPTILKGENPGGQFGAAIMYLGDINRDGFGDVAIGAPFENDNTGTVYIHKGTTEGLRTKYSQKIIGRDIASDILGFGVTISKAVDMDNNGFEDIAVGAHLSKSAMLLRSRPLVVIHYSFRSKPKILTQDLRNFDIFLCFTYKLFTENFTALTYIVNVDSVLGRASIGNSKRYSRNINIRKGTQPTCENLSVTIKSTPNLDIKTPIKVSVSYSLNYPVQEKSATVISNNATGTDFLCVRCPVLDEDKSNQTFFETEIPFTLDCGSDNECQSYLEMDIRFPELRGNTFVLGSSNYVKLVATVENKNENAYSTKLYLVLPYSVYFGETPKKCKLENDSAILCDIANPLGNHTRKQIDFNIDVRNVNNEVDKDHLDIYTRVITSSENSNVDALITVLRLERQADITIYGKTQQETNYYGNSSVDTSLLMKHTYKVEKFGVSFLQKLRVEIQVPYMYNIGNKNLIFLETSGVDAYFGEQPFSCKLGTIVQTQARKIDLEENNERRRRSLEIDVFKNISENKKEDLKINDEEIMIANKTLFLNCSTPKVNCFDVVCNFGPYNQQKVPASIELNLIMNLSVIIDVAKTMDMVLISTNGKVIIESPKMFIQDGHRPDSIIISTLFINDITKGGKVALWIIIVAAIIGLLLLLILILLFIKIGFFKRNKKEELANLKAAADQEDKILEIIEGSKDHEEDEETGELEAPFPEQINSSKEGLCDK